MASGPPQSVPCKEELGQVRFSVVKPQCHYDSVTLQISNYFLSIGPERNPELGRLSFFVDLQLAK